MLYFLGIQSHTTSYNMISIQIELKCELKQLNCWELKQVPWGSENTKEIDPLIRGPQ